MHQVTVLCYRWWSLVLFFEVVSFTMCTKSLCYAIGGWSLVLFSQVNPKFHVVVILLLLILYAMKDFAII